MNTCPLGIHADVHVHICANKSMWEGLYMRIERV